MGGGTSPVIQQIGYRGRVGDAVGLNSTTWDHAQNTDWTNPVDVVMRVRFLASDTVASTKSSNYSFDLEYNLNSGGWNTVDGTSPIQVHTSTQFTDGDAVTSSQITGGQNSFTNGEGDTNGSTGNISLGNGNDHTEVEFALLIDSAQVNDGDQIQLRLVGTDIAPSLIPTITVSAPATAAVSPMAMSLTVPAVTASYSEVVSATVSPVGITLTAPSVTATGAGIIAEVTFEGNDFSEVDSQTNSADQSINSSSPMVGSYDMDVYLDGSQTNTYATKGVSLGTNQFAIRLYLKHSTLTMANNDVFQGPTLQAGGSDIFAIGQRYETGNGYMLGWAWKSDSLGSFQQENYYSVAAGAHYIDIVATRETADGNGDGEIQFWIDGVLKQTVSTIDNFNIWANINNFHIGARASLDGGTSGHCFYDAFEMNDTGVRIGSVTGAETASVSPVAMSLTVPAVTATHQSTASVSPVAMSLTVVPVIASYVQVETVAVSPLALSLVVVSTTATVVFNASVSPISTLLTVIAVTATYIQIDTANVAPLAIILTSTTTIATYVEVEISGVSPIPITLVVVNATATYIQVENAAVAPVIADLTIVAVTASYSEVPAASVAPVLINITQVATTANYVATAAIVPVLIKFTVIGASATYVRSETASVAPAIVLLAVTATTAIYSSGTVAGVVPVNVTFTVISVTATFTQVETAAVAPIAIMLTLATVTASGAASSTADVSPVLVDLLIVDPTATYIQVETAVVSPVSLTLTPTSTTAGITVFSATVAPIIAVLIIVAVTATYLQGERMRSNFFDDYRRLRWERIHGKKV